MDHKKQALAREALLDSAKSSFRNGSSMIEWEEDDDILAYAKKYGIEKEVEHISQWAHGLVRSRKIR